MLTHEEIELRKHLPRVGDTVRSRKHGTLWRVMQKGERWAPMEDDPQTGNPRLVPAIYITFWKIVEGRSLESVRCLVTCTLHMTTPLNQTGRLCKDNNRTSGPGGKLVHAGFIDLPFILSFTSSGQHAT